ncbi:MAG: thioesterase family protein [Thermodesulfobacteriota bacterium]
MVALKPGTVHEDTLVVAEEHTAGHLGHGGLKVLATPVMVALMEGAARSLVDPHLEPGYLSVGTGLDIKHLAATPQGMRVTVRAELVRVAGRKLEFKVEVFDEKEKVGEGTHTRAIVNLKHFWDKLETKADVGLA